MGSGITKYHSDMLNYRYFENLKCVITITTDDWIELLDNAEKLLDDRGAKADYCEVMYWGSLIFGIIPPNVRIIRPDPMSRIR